MQDVAEKTAYANSKGLSVILCVGETLEQREAGSTGQVLPNWRGIDSRDGLCLMCICMKLVNDAAGLLDEVSPLYYGISCIFSCSIHCTINRWWLNN